MDASPFDQAAHRLLAEQQQQEQQQRNLNHNQKSTRKWSWFRSSAASTASTSSSCFTGGLSVDYRDCEAPSPTSSRPSSPSHSAPSSPRGGGVFCDPSSSAEENHQLAFSPITAADGNNTINKISSSSGNHTFCYHHQDARSSSSSSPRPSSPMEISASSSLMEIEFEWANDGDSYEEDSPSLFQQAFLEHKRMDRDILREQQQRHQQDASSFRPIPSGRGSGSGIIPSNVVFQDLLGSIGGCTDSEHSTPVPTVVVPTYHDGEHQQLPTWDPLHMREFNPSEESGYAMHTFYRHLNRTLSSPKRISKYLAILFGLLLVVFVTLDILGDNNSYNTSDGTEETSTFFSSSTSSNNDAEAYSSAVKSFFQGILQMWRTLIEYF